MYPQTVRLLRTETHDCGYFDGRAAQNLVVDPSWPSRERVFGDALRAGFRRSGDHIYRPSCPGCRACVAARVPVAEFQPDRSQRRCLTRNRDLAISQAPARIDDERFGLYQRYIEARHAGGGMDDANAVDMERFVGSSWSDVRFIDFRLSGALVAAAVTDFTTVGLSAVYTFFEPALAARGLGTLAILAQIAEARRLGLPHVYLGFWIEGHPKMGYKARFRPLEVLDAGHWRTFEAKGEDVPKRALADVRP